MNRILLDAIASSDVERACAVVKTELREGVAPWKIHLSLFPVVQRVMNPPFINPHLPKMYRIIREFLPYVGEKSLQDLILLEVAEYARRPKMEKIPEGHPLTSPIGFKEIEGAIEEGDPEKTAVLMATFMHEHGEAELCRRLLLLGSGYLDKSLGHSFSCPAFILLEMLDRKDEAPWPALAALADYFCKGGFHATPERRSRTSDKEVMNEAASGRGIINLHHTITRYAIERVHLFLAPEDYEHLLSAWAAFMGKKAVERVDLEGMEIKAMEDYSQFWDEFSRLQAEPLAASLRDMAGSETGRKKLGRYLIKGVCDHYQGKYNPHYLTGLGSTLWVIAHYRHDRAITDNALYQYLDYFCSDISSQR